MKLRTFLSVLLVYRSNFHVLHWMAEGEAFFTIHEKAAEYYDDILKDVDVVAEMILRGNGEIVNYKEALDVVEEFEDHEFLLIDSKELYDIEKFSGNAIKMFNDLLYCIEELLASDAIQAPRNVGIKATLEGLHDKYDLQANYLLKRFRD